MSNLSDRSAQTNPTSPTSSSGPSTSQRDAEIQLQRSEARYRLLFDAIDEAFCILEKIETPPGQPSDFRIIEANPAFTRQSGLSNVIGRTIREIVPNFEESTMSIYDHVAATGESVRFETQVAGLDIWTSVNAFGFDEAQHHSIAVVFNNITERKRAEFSLRQSEARLRLALEIAELGLWSWDLATGEGHLDARGAEIVGLPSGDLANVASAQLASIHPDDLARIEAEISSHVVGEHASRNEVDEVNEAYEADVFNLNYRVIYPNGSIHHVASRAHVLRDSDGRPTQLMGTNRDVTAEREFELALRESEERFRLLVEGARDYAMFMLDPDNRITIWSAGAERVFGWSEAEARGKSGNLIFTPEDRAQGRVETEINTALRQGRSEDRRWHQRKDGSRLFIDGMLIRLDDEAGQLRGFVKVGRDATRQHEAEEGLQRSHDDLEHRVEERTAELRESQQQLRQLSLRTQHDLEAERIRIARDVHDELGGSLTALKFALAQLSVDKTDPNAQDLRDDLFQQIDQLINNVRRIGSELRPPLLDKLGLIAALEWQAEEWERHTDITCILDVPSIDIALDEARRTALFRAFQEALTNVARHAQATYVAATLHQQDDQLVLIVQDDGRGLDLEKMRGGHTLGLLGMRERIHEVGGMVEITSAAEKGTTVSIHVPMQDAAHGTTATAQPTS